MSHLGCLQFVNIVLQLSISSEEGISLSHGSLIANVVIRRKNTLMKLLQYLDIPKPIVQTLSLDSFLKLLKIIHTYIFYIIYMTDQLPKVLAFPGWATNAYIMQI